MAEPALTLRAMRDSDAFVEMGRLFTTAVARRRVLERAGANAALVPAADLTPAEFWEEAAHRIVEGRFPCSLVDLLSAALQEAPNNPVLGRLHRGRPPGTGPITVLCLQAAPRKTSRMRLDIEYREIANATKHFKDRIAVEPNTATRPNEIIDVLLRTKPDVVHFAGHGDADGILYFEDENGNVARVTADTLGRVVGSVGGVRCVVLASCYSGIYAEALLPHVEAVVGARAPLPDEQAAAFAAGFYRALADNRDYRSAYAIGTAHMKLTGVDPSHMLYAPSE